MGKNTSPSCRRLCAPLTDPRSSSRVPNKSWYTESVRYRDALSNSKLQPNVFESTMDLVIDGLNSPGSRIRVDEECNPIGEPIRRITKLFRSPWLNLGFVRRSAYDDGSRRRQAHQLHRVSSAGVFNLPLPTVRFGKPQTSDIDARAPSLPRDPSRGDNKLVSSVGGYQGMFRNTGFVSCKPQASVFRPGRGERCRLSGAWSWLAEYGNVREKRDFKCWEYPHNIMIIRPPHFQTRILTHRVQLRTPNPIVAISVMSAIFFSHKPNMCGSTTENHTSNDTSRRLNLR